MLVCRGLRKKNGNGLVKSWNNIVFENHLFNTSDDGFCEIGIGLCEVQYSFITLTVATEENLGYKLILSYKNHSLVLIIIRTFQ